MPGPYDNIVPMDDAALLSHLDGYARTNRIAVSNKNRQVDAELLNKLVSGMVDLRGGLADVAADITGFQDQIDDLQDDVDALGSLDVVRADAYHTAEVVASADYRAAWQQALDAAQSNGRDVVLPPGQFFTVMTEANPSIRIKGHNAVRGAGENATHMVVIRASGDATVDFSVFGFECDHGKNAKVEGMRISGASSPAWAASTAYRIGQRRTNADGTVTRVYEVITAGTSAASGGPKTTLADITDGTVHWRYVGDVGGTSVPSWLPSRLYRLEQIVMNIDAGTPRAYVCITQGTSASSGGPTGTGASISDGSVTWKHLGVVSGWSAPPSCPVWTPGATYAVGQHVTNPTGLTSPVASGTSTSVTTDVSGASILNDTGVTMTVNAFAGRILIDSAGTRHEILSNTATQFRMSNHAGAGIAPASGAYTVLPAPDRVYRCIAAGVAAGSGGPTTTAADITDGTVHWAYAGDGDGSLLEVVLLKQNTAALYAPSKQLDATHYRFKGKNLKIDGFYTGYYATAGSVNSVNHLTSELEDCDVMSYQVKVAVFSDDTAKGTKKLKLTRTQLHSQNVSMQASSHGVYAAPNVGLDFDHVEWWDIADSEWCLQHYGGSDQPAGRVRIVGCTLYDTTNSGLWLTDTAAAIIANNTFLGGGALDVSYNATIVGNVFRPTPRGDYTAVKAGARFVAKAIISVVGNVFDLSMLNGQTTKCIDVQTSEDSNYLVDANQYLMHGSTAANANATGISMSAGAGTARVIVGASEVIHCGDGGSGTPAFCYANISNGIVIFKGGHGVGDFAVTGGAVKITGAGVQSVIFEGVDFDSTRSTAGNRWVIYADQNVPAGAVKGWGRFHDDRMDMHVSANLQSLRFPRQHKVETISPTAVTPISWVVGTTYRVGNIVKNASKVWLCTTAGVSAGDGPDGLDAGYPTAVTDGTAVWKHVKDGTTVDVLELSTDYDSYVVSGAFDVVLVNGTQIASILSRTVDTDWFSGAPLRLISSSAGTMNSTGVGNAPSSGGVVAADTVKDYVILSSAKLIAV